MRTSLAGRDDADDFFAIIVLPVRVHYQENRWSRPCDMRHSKRMPALLSAPVNAIQVDKTEIILKGQRCQLE